MTEMNCRHNVMKIDSLNMFADIKGGMNNAAKDVYFVRAVGETVSMNQTILEIDKKLDMEMSKNRLSYLRIHCLPKLNDIEDSKYYSEIFDKLYAGEEVCFKTIHISSVRYRITKALEQVMNIYQQSKAGISSTMKRSAGSKILFWVDLVMGECFENWTETKVVKVIADYIEKEHEYLFYLFLTFIGCDVLLLENKREAEFSEILIQYSQKLVLGDFGNTDIVPYAKTTVTSSTDIHSRRNIVVIPPRPAKKVQAQTKVQIPQKHIILPQSSGSASSAERLASATGQQMQAERLASATGQQMQAERLASAAGQQMQAERLASAAGQQIQAERQEKSFEELALLAASVVQIAVHDKSGKVVSTGSGIMIGEKGFILTNHHVASGGYFYSVRIEDDETVYPTDEIIKYNTTTDLAVIRIQKKLKPIPIYDGRKKLVRGQKVVAIGSPMGLFNSVSDGIISGFRTVDRVDMIQFTAPTSHGSSGGAVLNMYGELIGISTAGIDSGQNLNLAIGYENIKMFTNGFTS